MTIAFSCLLIAGLMPIIAVGFAKADRSFDNRQPRRWLEAQDGFRARAHAAHQNAFEAFPLFAAAVLTAYVKEVPEGLADGLAVAYVALRSGYIGAYLCDWPALRTVLWLAATAVAIGLFVIAILR